nr:MAG TPA: hypothetical protein [Caudoviricetes sp.]
MATAKKSAIYTVQGVILKVAYIANPNLSSKSGIGGLTMLDYEKIEQYLISVAGKKRDKKILQAKAEMDTIQREYVAYMDGVVDAIRYITGVAKVDDDNG